MHTAYAGRPAQAERCVLAEPIIAAVCSSYIKSVIQREVCVEA